MGHLHGALGALDGAKDETRGLHDRELDTTKDPVCEPAASPGGGTTEATEWTCPMHPEIVRSAPGSCPICGMALEPRSAAGDVEDPELKDMTRRFVIGAVLTVALVAIEMGGMLAGGHDAEGGGGRGSSRSARVTWPNSFSPRETLLVCNERAPRIQEGIRLVPWRDSLGALWSGRITS